MSLIFQYSMMLLTVIASVVCVVDLRQDMLTLQIIKIMENIWQNQGLDLRYFSLFYCCNLYFLFSICVSSAVSFFSCSVLPQCIGLRKSVLCVSLGCFLTAVCHWETVWVLLRWFAAPTPSCRFSVKEA